MLEQYEFEGEIFNVHPSQKEDFLKKYPNAQPKQSEPDFQTPTAPDAVVEEDTASDTESNSDPGSLDLQIDPNKFKVFDPKSINKPIDKEDPLTKKLEKIRLGEIQKRNDKKTENRALFRSQVKNALANNTPYQLGLKGNTIDELNQNGLESKITELASNAWNENIASFNPTGGFFNKRKEKPEGYTDVVH